MKHRVKHFDKYEVKVFQMLAYHHCNQTNTFIFNSPSDESAMAFINVGRVELSNY